MGGGCPPTGFENAPHCVGVERLVQVPPHGPPPSHQGQHIHLHRTDLQIAPGSYTLWSHANERTQLQGHLAVLRILRTQGADSALVPLLSRFQEVRPAPRQHVTQVRPLLGVVIHDHRRVAILQNVSDPPELSIPHGLRLLIERRVDRILVVHVAHRYDVWLVICPGSSKAAHPLP